MKLETKLFSNQLRAIPKVDLHRHLDCSMRWSTLIEIAPTMGIDVPFEYEKQREQFLVEAPMKDLNSVLKKFLSAQEVLSNEGILSRLAFEACEDAFNDGIRILELRYAPGFILEGHSTLTFDKIHKSIVRGIEMARRKWPMAIGLISIIRRSASMEEAEKVCDFTIANKDTFVGIDLADDEENFDPKKFQNLFEKAKKAGLHVTIHAGEINHPTAAVKVKESVQILGAERIGHGVQIIKNAEVLKYIKENKIPLEVCPISNWLTQAFPEANSQPHASHPIKHLIEAGILVTINSDDPGVFATTLSDEYSVLHQMHNFQIKDFEFCNDVAAKYSFIPHDIKQKVWPRKIQN